MGQRMQCIRSNYSWRWNDPDTYQFAADDSLQVQLDANCTRCKTSFSSPPISFWSSVDNNLEEFILFCKRSFPIDVCYVSSSIWSSKEVRCEEFYFILVREWPRSSKWASQSFSFCELSAVYFTWFKIFWNKCASIIWWLNTKMTQLPICKSAW